MDEDGCGMTCNDAYSVHVCTITITTISSSSIGNDVIYSISVVTEVAARTTTMKLFTPSVGHLQPPAYLPLEHDHRGHLHLPLNLNTIS